MPDINALPALPGARSPRGAVKLNGVFVPCVAINVDNNAYRAADTFDVTFAVGALPAAYGPAWFGSQSSIDCEVFMTTDAVSPANYQPTAADRLILGQVDDIEFDPLAGTIHITGRDWTAKLIDTKTSENFLNQTSSQIAQTLAARHGLAAQVDPTTTRVGTYYSQNHSGLSQERSEWDLLVELAAYEDFDVFVRGETLYFQAKPADAGARYVIEWRQPDEGAPEANVVSLRFDRSLTIAKGVVVTVRSWNSKSKRSFEAAWPKAVKSTKPGQSGAATPLAYHYTIAGLTQDQAIQRAKAIYEQIVQHMVRLSADLPGDMLLDCSMLLQVRGTGTSWDQTYYPDSVKRSMSIDEGFRMTVTAKNISDTVENQT
ncbi:MAG: hypothetical protein OC190_00210 [Novosphingobium aromaticivorans]|nr:hypothetical protein [Novosphingobium aromaticivorans]